jgi:hypothetical protein
MNSRERGRDIWRKEGRTFQRWKRCVGGAIMSLKSKTPINFSLEAMREKN